MKNPIDIPTHDSRRHGSNCLQCGKKLGEYRLDGQIDNKSVSFCSFACLDTYKDKKKEPKP